MTQFQRSSRGHLLAMMRSCSFLIPLLLLCILTPSGALQAQDVIQTETERTIRVPLGATAVITRPDTISLVDINNTNVANVRVPVENPTQVIVYALGTGSTTLIIGGETGRVRMYTIEVTADVASLQRQVDELFPGSGLSVTSTGTSVVLSGAVRDDRVVQRALELAANQGIPVVNNVVAPPPNQILLHVEFAEVTRSAVKEIGGDLIRVLNPQNLEDAFGSDDDIGIETLSEGFVNLLIQGDDAELEAIIRALKNTGEFRSLAQPNLVTREGEEASFLAGGEFPFPSVQAGGAANAVGIQWREFGIKLNFTPNITNSGNIRLMVAPEVSSLDFANGLTISGFNIPSLISRKVETDVELRPGQTLAIGGLLDNTLARDVDKIPILGDIPILGFFFRSESARQSRSELLVLVTPHILDPDNLPAQAVPTGDPATWDWDAHIREWIDQRTRGGAGGGGVGGGPGGGMR